MVHTPAEAMRLTNDGNIWNTQQNAAKGALIPNRGSEAWQEQQQMAEINIIPAKGVGVAWLIPSVVS